MVRGNRRLWLALELLMCFAAAAAQESAPSAEYRQSFEKWKAELVQDRQRNWLPLAGLFWLKPGLNTFGSDAGNTILLKKAPPWAGAFKLWDSKVTLLPSSGAAVTIGGKPVTAPVELQSDGSGNPTVVELGSLQMHVIQRGQRTGIRVKDLESPAASKYKEPVFFPLDSSYRVTAKWLPAEGKQTVDVPNALGDVSATPIAGTAVFELNGQQVRLTDLGGDAAKGLFFVFSDSTSKTDTYPGGRFLDTEPVKNGAVVLDFNRAYNPPCSVTPYATCPLAPKENRLTVAIAAGEKYERKSGHH